MDLHDASSTLQVGRGVPNRTVVPRVSHRTVPRGHRGVENAPCTLQGAPSISMVTPGRKSLLDRLARTAQEPPRGAGEAPRGPPRPAPRTVGIRSGRWRRVGTPRIDVAEPHAIAQRSDRLRIRPRKASSLLDLPPGLKLNSGLTPSDGSKMDDRATHARITWTRQVAHTGR